MKALKKRKTVSFHYINANSGFRTATVQFIYVYFKWYAWYALGYDKFKEKFLVYKINRMNNLHFAGDEVINNYNIEQILAEKNVEQNKRDLETVLKYPKTLEQVINEYFKGNLIEETETYFVRKVSLKVDDFITFSMLLGLSNKVEIISPKELKDKVKQHLINSINFLEKSD